MWEQKDSENDENIKSGYGYENNFEYEGGVLKKKIVDKNVDKNNDMNKKTDMNVMVEKGSMNEIEESEIKMKKNSIIIQLGDVIKFISPSNEQLHQHSFLVVFCDKNKLKMVNVESGFPVIVKMIGDHLDPSEKVDSISILFREEYPGYALQNGLVPGSRIQIHFGGDWVYSVTGKITNLEEDRIEVHAWKEDIVFYIDFAYNGIPETPPFIENIEILDQPPSDLADSEIKESEKGTESEEEKSRESEKEKEKENDIHAWSYEEKEENSEEAEPNILEELRNEYVQADGIARDWVPEVDIEIGDILVSVNQRLEVSEKDKRYSLIAQKSDLMDELLSRIPNYQRTPVVMKNIEHSIKRFEELHQKYSLQGENGGVIGNRPLNSKFYKPLVKSLSTFDKFIPWILPVTSVRKRFWFDILEKNKGKGKSSIFNNNINNDNDDNYEDDNGMNNDQQGYFVKKQEGYDDGSGFNEVILNPQMVHYYDMIDSIDKWKNGGSKSNEMVGYRNLLKDLDIAMSPIVDYIEQNKIDTQKRKWGYVTVLEDMESILDNRPEDFDFLPNEMGNILNSENLFSSSILLSNNEKDTTENDIQTIRRSFVLQKYIQSISLLKLSVEKTGKKIIEKEVAIPSEKMFLKSFLFLPEVWMNHSRIFYPGTNIAMKSNLGLFWPQKSRILNKKADIQTVEIKDLTREYIHGESSDNCLRKDLRGKELGKDGIRFLSKIQHFDLAKEGVKTLGKTDNWLVSFLNTVIPNTCYLIDLMTSFFEKEHTGNLTILEFIKLLEPFGLYLSDIGFQDVNHIQKIIRKRIVDLRTKLADGRKMFNELEIYLKREREKHSNSMDTETIFKFFKGKGEKFRSMFIEQYGLNIEYVGSSEALSRIIDLDGGTLFENLLSFLSFSLLTPSSMIGGRMKLGSLNESMGRLDEGFHSFYGGQRYLSKRYSSLQEMMNDNNKTDVYWDKKLDKLPYHLAEKYANERGGNENNGDEIVKSGDGDGNAEMEGGKTMRQKMSASEFLEYLAMNLKERHFCPQEDAMEMANILISGKRGIRDGEYASVVLGGNGEKGSEIGYYKRNHHNWERDHSIDFGMEESENKVFSNLNQMGGGLGFGIVGGSLKSTEKISVDGKELVLLSPNPYKKNELLKNVLQEEELKGGDEEKKQQRKIEKELIQRKMQEKIENMATNIQELTEKQFIHTQRIKSLKKAYLYRHDYMAHALGVLASSMINAREIVISPYMSLRDLILEQTDFIKKQQNIVSFYHEFCREPIPGMEGEIKHWKYCVASNARLLPSWIYQLALEFCQGGDYSGLLDRLCTEIGTSSEDGEAVVDKYSGLVMTKKEYNIDEGVDENGFKKFTRAVMDEGAGEIGNAGASAKEKEEEENEMDEEDDEELAERVDRILADGTNAGTSVGIGKSLKLDRVYDNENTEQMAKVCKHYLQSMRIKELEIQENVLDFVIAMVSELMNDKSFMDDEARFEKKVKMSQKAGKQVANVNYKQYSQQLLVYATICLTLIGLQTFQGVVKAKTFSNCIPSLKGYPAGEGGRDDMSGLKYMACILVQVRIEEEPWNAIPIRNKEDFHMTKMTGMIDEKIFRRPLVMERIEQKRVWLEGKSEEVEKMVVQHSEKWSEFRPPLLADLVLDGKETQMVASDFISDWKEEMQRSLKTSDAGRKSQKMGVIRTKLLALGVGIFERINRVVDNDESNFLLKTASGVAYLENGCCASNGVYPLKYFSEKEPEIVGFIKSAWALSSLMNWAEERRRTVLLFHNSPTRFDFDIANGIGKTWATYYKENIYSALIHYFHYNRPTPFPEYLRPVYEEMPKNFPKHVSEKEQREWLEKEGRHYDVSKLQECMMLVNRHNILPSSSSSLELSSDFGEKGIGQNLLDFINDAEFELGRGIKKSDEVSENTLIDMYYLMKEVIQNWTPGTMKSDSLDEKLLTLNLYLAEKNDGMIRKIREIMRPKNEPENARLQFLEKIQDWNLTKNLDMNSNLVLGLSNSDTLHQVTMFIRNMCEFIFSYSENIYYDIKTPKHWGFDLKHYQLLQNFIQKGMGEFPGLFNRLMMSRFRMDLLPFFLEFVSKKFRVMFGQIRRLLALFPVFTPLVFRNNVDVGDSDNMLEFHALFPKETCYGVYVFCLYFLILTHLESLKDPEIMREDKKNKRQDALVRQAVDEDEFNDELMVPQSRDILENNERDISSRYENTLNMMDQSRYNDMESKVRMFFFAFLDVEMEKKSTVDKTYDQLKREQEKTQEREKIRITDRLKKLSIYARNVERTLKTFKLGQWGVGQEKGLYRYDKETFVREIDEQLGVSGEDVVGEQDAVMDSENLVDMNPDRMTDGLDLMQGEREEENELNVDIMGLSEEWFDGEYGYDNEV